jgi:paraquat-inducible protein B
LLTGSAFIAFDFFPAVTSATVDWSQNPPQLPTTPGQLEATEASLGNIVKKLDKMPLQKIGDNLQRSLGDLDLTLVSARGTLENASTTLNTANGLVEPSSEQIQEVNQTLQELRRAARSVRVLTDYLEQHPDALLRGKRGEAQ